LNCVHEEIKSKLNLEIASYISVQSILSSNLVLKNSKIKVHNTVILLVVLYGCETWTVTLMENHKWRVFENRMLRRIFGPKKEKYQEAGEDYIMRSFINFYVSKNYY
jgi:hypothetical protein